MRIIYSKHFSSVSTTGPGNSKRKAPVSELRLRYDAYLNTCEKFKAEIAAIQQYFPGWMPGFYRR